MRQELAKEGRPLQKPEPTLELTIIDIKSMSLDDVRRSVIDTVRGGNASDSSKIMFAKAKSINWFSSIMRYAPLITIALVIYKIVKKK